MDVASELNKDVVTEFPILKAVGPLQPGVYLITARPWKEKTSDSAEPEDVQLAAQWMVVSDLGLTAISGEDGVHGLVQSLGSAGPVAGVELKLVARNNEVLATKTTGADGRVDFDPGLSRGKGGSAPGLLVATLADDYNFLNLTQNGFDLTDRGVGGRDAPEGLDAFLYTERGVYRSGETVFATALLRDAQGVAKTGLPLTLVVKRPDGVEYKRATVADEGLGGRAFAVPLLAGSAAGKWTIEAYADPKGDPIGETQFLLEDYIPERLDFSVKTAKPYADPGEPIALSLDARFLYGAPASGLDVTGAIRLPSGSGWGACRLSRLRRRPRRRRVHHGRDPVRRQGRDRREGACRAFGRPARRDRDPAARSQADRGRRRARRADGRAHRDAAGAAQGRDGRGQEDVRRFDRRRRPGDLRGDRGRARRNARRPQGRRMVALSGDQRLPVVQRRRTLVL